MAAVNNSNTVEIEIIGGGAGRYVAFAFGTVERMEDADLYYCTENGVFSGVIRTLRQAPSTELNDGVSLWVFFSFFFFFFFWRYYFCFLCR